MNKANNRYVRPPALGGLLLFLILCLIAVRNLPWQLDDYDQAKQAYTAFEIAQGGSIWLQHTAYQNMATKPPLMAWLSVSLHAIIPSWPLAWRLPSLLAFASILALLYRFGQRLHGGVGGLLALAAFSLNLMAPRLATLVRTDMLLTLGIASIGLLIAHKIEEDQPWTRKELGLLAVLLTCSLFTKGPLIFAFLGPALLLWPLFCRRHGWHNQAWGAAWPWLIPLLLFGAWTLYASLSDHAFMDQVVNREFLSRFQAGEASFHRSQPLLFYAAHLLHKFAPWSLLVIGALARKSHRLGLAKNRQLLWLLSWALGGLIFMSLIPSKRVDRIFPVLPPLCLIAAWGGGLLADGAGGRWNRISSIKAVLAAAVLITTSHTAGKVLQNHHRDHAALADFGAEVRRLAAAEGSSLAFCPYLPDTENVGENESMLLYLRLLRMTGVDDAADAWRQGQLNSIVADLRIVQQDGGRFPGHRIRAQSREAPDKQRRYVWLVRDQEAP